MANAKRRLCPPLLGDTPLKRRVIRAISWSTLGTGTVQALFLVASILTARILGAEEFGRLSIIQLTLNLLVSFIAPSFGWTLTRTAATLRESNPKRLGELVSAVALSGTAVTFVLAAGLFLLAPWMCFTWFIDPRLQVPMQITALSVFANGVLALQVSLLAGFEAFRENAFLNALRGIILAVLMVLGALVGGLNGAVWGSALSSLLVVGVGGGLVAHRLRKYAITLHRARLRTGYEVLIHVSLPSFLSTVLGSITIWLGSMLLARLPNGLVQVAVFNAANHWKTMLLFLPVQISQSIMPILANLWSQGELRRLTALVRASLWINLLVTGLPCLFLMVAADPIMHLYRLNFGAEALAFRLLIASSVMTALCGVLGYTMLAIGRLWQGLMVNALWAMVFIGTTWTMLPHGVLSLGIAYFASYSLLFLVSLVYVVYSLGASVRRRAA
ncbi:MAG: oligosaccharide flippase family protein [Armatimonadota bacterium]